MIATLPADLAADLRAAIEGLPGAAVAVGRLARGAMTVDVVAGRGASRDPERVFQIGSVGKTVTATLLADAVRRGEVRLDEPLDAFLPPGVRAPSFRGRAITLEHLATHRSGLPALPANFDLSAPDPFARYDRAKLFAFLNAYELPCAPGVQYEYSNAGYGLLGLLLAERAGTTYAALARERVFAPLGMASTSAGPGNDPRLLPGYDESGRRVPPWRFDVLAGAGAVTSTARDMLLYAAAQLPGADGPLAAAARLAHAPRADCPQGRIGLAWSVAPDGTLWHNGGTNGFRSMLALAPRTRSAAVLLANADVSAGLLESAAILLLAPSRQEP
ncbi:MAG: hypothetical protein QOI11_3195 [Candidatus Eremiobacteraeota bacterium]|nr:hypothetical protein [Candidatus Eremiobacteraeota bacterium]